MHAEKAWNHDAFFDYCDRWMYQDDAESAKVIKAATGGDYFADWIRQKQAWDDFVDDMWAKHRAGEGMPATDGWKKPHDDSYLRTAIEKGQKQAEAKPKQ